MIIRTLQTLDAGERRRFAELARSDYWHKNEKVRRLTDHLLGLAPHFPIDKLDRELIWQELFQPLPYEERKFNNYLSDCLQLLYQFLALESYRQNEDLQLEQLQEQLVNRRLNRQAERSGRKWQKLQSKSPRRDALYYQAEFRRFHQLDQIELRRSRRSFSEHLQAKSEELDRFYAIRQLENYAEMLSRGNIVKGGYELHYLEELLARFDRNDLGLQDIPTASIFVHILRMFMGDAPEQRFHILTGLFQSHHAAFAPTDLRAIYNYLLNYCVKQINSGRTDYYRQIFQLYELLIQQNLIAPGGQLSQWTYTNIITTGIRLGELEWTEAFLHEYEPLLPEGQRHNAFQYNLAALRFEKKAYGEALAQLHQIEFTDAFYHMAAKLVQLKIYYLLEETEALLALIEATRQFIVRNRQLSDFQQQINLNFLRQLLKINQLKQEQGRWRLKKWQENQEKIRQKLQQPQFHVANKDWLLDALGQLN